MDASFPVQVGAPAPAFTLPGTDGSGEPAGRGTFSLADHTGEVVVLVFYPADASPVCTAQLQAYSEDIARFADVGARVLAISPQSVEEHEAFARAEGGFGFPLLADVDKAVARAYGVPGPMGFYRRSVFVVDGGGTVRYAHRSTAGLTFRPVSELLDAIAAARLPAG